MNNLTRTLEDHIKRSIEHNDKMQRTSPVMQAFKTALEKKSAR